MSHSQGDALHAGDVVAEPLDGLGLGGGGGGRGTGLTGQLPHSGVVHGGEGGDGVVVHTVLVVATHRLGLSIHNGFGEAVGFVGAEPVIPVGESAEGFASLLLGWERTGNAVLVNDSFSEPSITGFHLGKHTVALVQAAHVATVGTEAVQCGVPRDALAVALGGGVRLGQEGKHVLDSGLLASGVGRHKVTDGHRRGSLGHDGHDFTEDGDDLTAVEGAARLFGGELKW